MTRRWQAAAPREILIGYSDPPHPEGARAPHQCSRADYRLLRRDYRPAWTGWSAPLASWKVAVESKQYLVPRISLDTAGAVSTVGSPLGSAISTVSVARARASATTVATDDGPSADSFAAAPFSNGTYWDVTVAVAVAVEGASRVGQCCGGPVSASFATGGVGASVGLGIRPWSIWSCCCCCCCCCWLWWAPGAPEAQNWGVLSRSVDDIGKLITRRPASLRVTQCVREREGGGGECWGGEGGGPHAWALEGRGGGWGGCALSVAR